MPGCSSGGAAAAVGMGRQPWSDTPGRGCAQVVKRYPNGYFSEWFHKMKVAAFPSLAAPSSPALPWFSI